MVRDVHTEHCCIRHGCKYGDLNCTVVKQQKSQSYMCEECGYEYEELWDWAHLMNEMYDKGRLKEIRRQEHPTPEEALVVLRALL